VEVGEGELTCMRFRGPRNDDDAEDASRPGCTAYLRISLGPISPSLLLLLSSISRPLEDLAVPGRSVAPQAVCQTAKRLKQ
jgi:hypothetical protein